MRSIADTRQREELTGAIGLWYVNRLDKRSETRQQNLPDHYGAEK